MPSGTGRALLALGVGLLVALPPASGAPGSPYRGRLLVDVLRELQDGGLELIYSSAVVPDDLRVSVDPSAAEPREMLEEMLAPLGLQARDGPRGAILIVPAERTSGTVRGRVLSAARRDPIAGATVHVRGTRHRAVSGADGAFTLRGVPVGLHAVTVEAFGFLAVTIPEVPVGDDQARRLVVELDSHPAFVKVVVIPSRHSLVRQDPGAMRSVNREDIVLAPSIAGDISRTVQQLPGIAAADGSAALNPRGSVARDVSFVLDGLELYDPFHLQSFQSPYSLIDSNLVDRVSFLGGGYTAELGDRHGGFVDISTMGAGATAGGELELGTLNSRVTYRAPLGGPGGSWLVSARGWYPEVLVDSFQLSSGEPLDPRFADLYGKVAVSLSPGLLLSAHGLLVYDRLQFQETGEPVNESVDALTRNRYGWVRLLSAGGTRLTTETTLSGGRIGRIRDGVSAADEAITVDDRRTVRFLGLRHDSVWQISGTHLLKAGAQIRRLDAAYRYALQISGDPASSSVLRLDPDGTSVGLYVAHRAQVGTRVTTELGLRWDRQTYIEDDQLSPRFNLRWHLGKRSDLRLALGRFTQSQRIHELDVEDGQTAFRPAEVSEQAEASFQHELSGGLRLRVDGYYRRLTDLRPRYENLFEPVDLFPETAEDRVEIAPSEARLRGLEVMARGAQDRSLFWQVSYTLASAEDRVDGRHVPRSWDQTHAGKFLVGYQRRDRWLVSLSGSAHTGWPTTPVSAAEVMLPDGTTEIEVVPGERNSDRFRPYLRLDLTARRSIPVRRGRLWVTATVVNLTDRDNPCCVNDFILLGQPDGGVDVRPDLEAWLGITPSVSFLWEF